MTSGAGHAIEVENLAFRYAAGGFSLEVPRFAAAPGEKVACIGPSGSGKSTFLQLLAGILVPAAGKVAVGGVDLAGLGDAARRQARIQGIGLIFQEFELLEHLSVRENILLPFLVNPALMRDAGVAARLDELARAAGLERHLRRKPRVLSHGERQRVAVCRALITAPRLLLADEPTGSLDQAAAAAVLELLLRAAGPGGATLVLVTHERGQLSACDQVLDLAALAGGGEG